MIGANTEKYFVVSHFKCTEPSMSWGVYGVQLAGRALTKNIWLKIGPNLVIKKIGLNLVIKTLIIFLWALKHFLTQNNRKISHCMNTTNNKSFRAGKIPQD